MASVASVSTAVAATVFCALAGLQLIVMQVSAKLNCNFGNCMMSTTAKTALLFCRQFALISHCNHFSFPKNIQIFLLPR